jgi:hypothetical protein
MPAIPAAVAIWATVAASAATIAATGYELAQPKNTPTAAPSQTQQNQQALEASYAQAEQMRKRQGAASTILTGPQGTTGQPSVFKTTLG